MTQKKKSRQNIENMKGENINVVNQVVINYFHNCNNGESLHTLSQAPSYEMRTQLKPEELSLEMRILNCIINSSTVLRPSFLYEEISKNESISEDEFNKKLRSLYEEGFIKAVDSWNGGLLLIQAVTPEGHKFRREQLDKYENKYKPNNESRMNLNINNLNATNAIVTNENYGNISMTTSTSQAYGEIDKLISEIKQLPMNEADSNVIVTIEEDVEQAKSGKRDRLKALMPYYQSCLSGYVVTYTAPVFQNFAKLLIDLIN